MGIPEGRAVGGEADHLPPSIPVVTNGRSYTSPQCSDGVHRDCVLLYQAARFPSVYECDMRASDLNKQQQLQVFSAFEMELIRTQGGWCKYRGNLCCVQGLLGGTW